MGLFQLPRLAERRLAARDFALVDRLWRDWSPSFAAPADELAAVKDALRGREREVLAYYRALFSRATPSTARLLRRRPRVPSLYVHGLDDGCIGVELTEGSRARLRRPDRGPSPRRRALRAPGSG